MFITHDHFRSHTSELFAGVGEAHFDITELALERIWFMVSFIESESIEGNVYEFQRTLLLSSPEQVRDLLEVKTTVHEVQIVTPCHVNGSANWMMEPLVSVWDANEPSGTALNTYIFETGSGRRYSNSAMRTPVDKLAVEDVLFHSPRKAS